MLGIVNRYSLLTCIVIALLNHACGGSNSADNAASGAPKALNAVSGTPVLDGSDADEVWETAEWQPIQQLWAGAKPAAADFSGQYKVCWDENNLYVLAEITDDTLADTHADGLDRYWNDDCLVVLVDEDASGGMHQFDYNAFAYHISLDGHITDVAADSTYQYFDNHVVSRRTTRGGVSVWEVAVKLYDGKTYNADAENIPKTLSKGKKMGFAVAYCDNDRSTECEHLMGSAAQPVNQDASVNASLLDILELQ